VANPALGRFVQADTLVPDPADPQSLNRYTYVRNNPLKYVDPTGHMDDAGDYLTGGGGTSKRGNQNGSGSTGPTVTLPTTPVGGTVLSSPVGWAEGLELALPEIGPWVTVAGPWVGAGACVGVGAAIAVVGFCDSSLALPSYEQPLPPEGGLGLTTALNVTVMSEYSLWLTEEASDEVEDLWDDENEAGEVWNGETPLDPSRLLKPLPNPAEYHAGTGTPWMPSRPPEPKWNFGWRGKIAVILEVISRFFGNEGGRHHP
jgi:hypothetical protein